MEQNNPNWVAERAKCDMQELWACLCDLMRENVKRVNAEAEERGWGVAYTLPVGEQTGTTKRYAGQKETGSFRWKYDSTTGCVRFLVEGPDRSATLTTRWDAPTSRCCLVVTLDTGATPIEFPHVELWKAVQYILEPFFFPDDG